MSSEFERFLNERKRHSNMRLRRAEPFEVIPAFEIRKEQTKRELVEEINRLRSKHRMLFANIYGILRELTEEYAKYAKEE